MVEIGLLEILELTEIFSDILTVGYQGVEEVGQFARMI